MMTIFRTLFRKELLDASRDKRSVMAGLYYAVGTPLLMCLLFSVLLKQLSSSDELLISIDNANAAPALVHYLANKDIRQGEGAEVKAIRLVVSTDFQQQLQQGRPATVIIDADRADDQLQTAIRRLERELGRYNSEIATLRLMARGIDPQLMQPIDVQMQDQATPDSRGGTFLGIASLSIILTLFYAAMNLAIDTSAGERERNSLTLLLSQPLSSLQLVLAKIAAIACFSMLGLVVILLVSKFTYGMVPWQQLGFNISLDADFMLFTLLVGLPLALLSASLQVMVSFVAKSFKEAQTYVTMVLLVPVALSMVTTYNIAPDHLQWLPIAAQQQAMIGFLKGSAIAMPQLLVSSLLTLAIFAACSYASSRLLKSEKVVFGL
ncbi:ABC transporter permease [Rheinheimera maricola]|uniref:ABC transporter permease subunit n=1 Tax=Rheinheimera maricola TaxID=2793282 RepID=A0ABS7X7C7_9GAMM|nr:ABC transporter permease subunit [Rheinheimera maricola]MBZ9611448.1 ABC transporter permease subunit [Rheinheimera maricola]